MHKNLRRNPTLTTHTQQVSEVHLELNREELQSAIGDSEFLIIRVPTRGPSGRPASKTMRLHKDQLLEPKVPGEDGHDWPSFD